MAKGKKRSESAEIRTGMLRARVYNEGNHVYLYDDANLDALQAAEAFSVVISGKTEGREDKFEALRKRRILVVYELMQDDPIDVAVSVGAPLTTKEKSSAAWYKTQQTVLSLPSGKLCIETADSCRFAPDEPLESGAVIDVPPGEYLLTLHRVNWDDLGESKEDRPDLPTEVVTLTSIAQTKIPSRLPLVLSWGDLVGTKAEWETQGRAIDGEFQGTVKSGFLSPIINLTPKLVKTLGWRWGMRLRAVTDQWQADVLFLSGCNSRLSQFTHGAQVDEWLKSVPLVTSPTHANTPGLTLIDLVSTAGASAGTPSPYTAPEQGMPIRITSLPDPFITPHNMSLLTDFAVDGTCVHARVLSRSETCLTLNVSWAILKEAKNTFNKPLVLISDKVERSVVSRSDQIARREQAEIRNSFLRRIAGCEELLARIEQIDATSNGQKADYPSLQRLRPDVLNVGVPQELESQVPLGVVEYPHWETPAASMLCLTPLVGRATHLDLPIGTSVTLRAVQ